MALNKTTFTAVILKDKAGEIIDILFPDMHNRSLYNPHSNKEELNQQGTETYCIDQITKALLNAEKLNKVLPFKPTTAKLIDHELLKKIKGAAHAERLSVNVNYCRPVNLIERFATILIWTTQLTSTALMALSTLLSVHLILQNSNLTIPLLLLIPQISMRLVMFVITNAAVAIQFPGKKIDDLLHCRRHHKSNYHSPIARIFPYIICALMGAGASAAQEVFNYQGMKSVGEALASINERPSWVSNEFLSYAAILYATLDGITNLILNLNLTLLLASKWANHSCPRRHRFFDLPTGHKFDLTANSYTDTAGAPALSPLSTGTNTPNPMSDAYELFSSPRSCAAKRQPRTEQLSP